MESAKKLKNRGVSYTQRFTVLKTLLVHQAQNANCGVVLIGNGYPKINTEVLTGW